MTEQNFNDLASKWWSNFGDKPDLTRRAKNKPIVDAVFNVADMIGHNTNGLKQYLKMILPRKSKVDGEQVSIYENSYKYSLDRTLRMDPGRFIKRIFPSCPDKVVEAFAIWYKNNIAFDSGDYKLVIGTTREDFKNAFVNHRHTSGLTFENYQKSISDSCMRYSFDGVGCHPSEAYASGDFEVVTVKDRKGKTRARCVVRVKLLDDTPCYVHGYIYADNDHSAGLIQTHLESKSATPPERCDFWHEARLLNIRIKDHGANYAICPYVDGNRYVARYSEDHLILINDDKSNGCEYNFNGTCGYVRLTTDSRSFYIPKKKNQ